MSHQAKAQRHNIMDKNQHDREQGRAANIGFVKLKLVCFNDSLVQRLSSFFQLNICAKHPPLQPAENRLPQA